jgi:formate hydrogenlyase subunit 3/multisubunit Na+/H+ antiporter MnhD subunit
MMTLPGYALIRFEHRNPANCRAARKYLIMMQLACGLTLVGAELLTRHGDETVAATFKYDFAAVQAHLPALLVARPGLVACAFALFLVGFGIKLGIWPFGQVWLPDAHPAAPSPVSALLSGVMIKTGVYGLMRYFLWLVPVEAQSAYPLAAWGGIMAALGTITLFTGTMQALQQHQTKRLLAFHSIGQAGYILLGLGTCLVLLPASHWALVSLAALGLFGALFHTLNHALFKSLLFLNAGALLQATGTQDLNRLGGLLHRMPITGLTALAASLSIAGVPLFNGFVSKWSICTATIQGAPLGAFLPLCAIVAILTSALTLASFVKFFGAAFLGRTSATVARLDGRPTRFEAGWMMHLPQIFLATACLLLGLLPWVAVHLFEAALATSPDGLGGFLGRATLPGTSWWLGVAATERQGAFAPLILALLLTSGFGFAIALARLGGGPRRAAVPWLCGYATEVEAHRYVAQQFYADLKRHFRWLGGHPHSPHPRIKGP